MGGGKYLLLLPAFVLVVRCQQKPQVSLFPDLKQIFIGDFLKLSCNASPRESAVKWFLNGNIQNNTENILKIPVAAPKDSGSYQCESNGQKSENFPINVLEYHPIASLTLETGQPVMRKGSSVILKIENEDGLKGWNCWVTRGDRLGKIILNLQNDSVSLTFQANRLAHPDTIFWCTDKPQSCRSNQITVRTSDNTGALEMYPLPAVAGDSLTLKCLVWGTNKVSNAEFYKDGLRITSVLENTYEIKDVTESQVGKYKCHANYKYIDQTVATPHQLVSDDQEVLVQRRPVTPELSEGMLCSCPLCNKDMSPRLYKKDGQSWTLLNSNSEAYSPGTYRCRFVMKDMRTLLSNSVEYKLSSNLLMVVIIGMIVAALALFVLAFYFYKKRDTTEPIYQDVPLRSQGDAKYETLQKARGRESEYDTLNPEASGGERKDGEYEALKKEGMQEGLYHSLGAQGTPGGEGGYEALKKEGMQEGLYHSLGAPGTAGGEGAYEALKKEGMQEGVYHSLGAQGAAGEDGGYEALKKESMKDGEYQTLKTEQAVKKPDEELEIVES